MQQQAAVTLPLHGRPRQRGDDPAPVAADRHVNSMHPSIAVAAAAVYAPHLAATRASVGTKQWRPQHPQQRPQPAELVEDGHSSGSQLEPERDSPSPSEEELFFFRFFPSPFSFGSSDFFALSQPATVPWPEETSDSPRGRVRCPGLRECRVPRVRPPGPLCAATSSLCGFFHAEGDDDDGDMMTIVCTVT